MLLNHAGVLNLFPATDPQLLSQFDGGGELNDQVGICNTYYNRPIWHS